MKIVVIKLEKVDESHVEFLLGDIAKKIEQGYTSGMGSPVDWTIEKSESVNERTSSLMDKVRTLRDANSHVCTADENDNALCTCDKYDAIIDSLEEQMYNEE